MSTVDASQLLRPGLLEGLSIVLAGAPRGIGGAVVAGAVADEVAGACAGLGARVLELTLDRDRDREPGAEDRALEQDVDRLRGEADGSLGLLVVDGAGLFCHALATAEAAAAGSEASRAALRVCLAASWSVTRAIVNRAFLLDGHGGRIVYLAPAADAGDLASGARRGLENLARTLSIEWARHAITTVAVVPASGSQGEAARQVGALTAYLASPAGAYFSGCLLDLSAAGALGGAVSEQR
ncbi:MAG: hypothetical protein ACRDJX_03665 [Solirubrobacteraceae bacterium]